ncbi:MAG: DUF1858 domain-containing protein [Candidatus Micrarchaeota archaeon]|nr:DUF1858 domain-containing protein [Candidatus Micrarchaeota archaeon]
MPIKITKDTPIGELVLNYPETVDVLLEYGFHCIGCGLSAYETIEQGAAVHGLNENEIQQLVRKLRAVAKKSIKSQQGEQEKAAAVHPDK